MAKCDQLTPLSFKGLIWFASADCAYVVNCRSW